MSKFYLHENGEQSGPFSIEDLQSKNLLPDTHVWTEGMSEWRKASEVEELRELLNKIPPPFQAKQPNPKAPIPQVEKKKSSSKFWSFLRLFIGIGIIAAIIWVYVDDQVKSDARVNIRSLVSVGNNAYKYSELGGIYGLELVVYNNSNYLLDKVTVKVDYIKANGEIWQTKYLEGYLIQPNTKETLKAPDSNRGTKVEYEIVSIESKEIGLYN
jgi:hypothetical protein